MAYQESTRRHCNACGESAVHSNRRGWICGCRTQPTEYTGQMIENLVGQVNEVYRRGFLPLTEVETLEAATSTVTPFHETIAGLVMADPATAAAAKAKRNRAAREHYDAMKSLGLKKTPYGWE